MLLISVSLAVASFTSNPNINPGISTIYTDQDLECRWTIDATTTANVTWYRNNIVNRTYSRSCTSGIECYTETSGNVPKSDTTKDDTWICSVTYYNGTDYETQNDTIIIQDSVPTTPRLYWQNGSEIINGTIAVILEDSTTIFFANSSDADDDGIIYTLQSNNANCAIDESTGEITCNPSTEAHTGLKTLRFRSEDENTGATRGYVNYSINVSPVNDAPTFSPALQDQTVFEGNALSYTVSGVDDENNFPFNFSISSDLASALIITSTSNTSASITLNHSGQNIAQYIDRGNHTITVNITDIYGDSSSDTFNLEVIPTNHLANITVYVENSSSLTQGGSLTIRINATDIDNDTLTFTTSNTAMYNISYSSTDKSNPNGTSFANATISVGTLTNNHVINNYFTLTVFDSKQNSSTLITLNITNTNDAPVINEISNNAANTLNNVNITNLTAYTGVLFRYYVNSTDIDMLTYAGDTLTYATNDSDFPINSTTGLMTFTKMSPGTFVVRVNVTDSLGLTDSRNAIITINNNNPPYFSGPLTLGCAEYDANNNPYNCTINVSQYSNDSDSGDYVSSYWTNSTLFSINSQTGLINFRANQSQLGNYSFLINITDTRGGMNSTTIQVSINNTNNVPSIISISGPENRMSVDQNYNYGITAYDLDIDLNNTYENLTFNYTILSGPSSDIFNILKTDADNAVLSINPVDSSDSGNYTINIKVTDFYGNNTNSTINFFLYNVTVSPNITSIKPFGSPLANNSVNDSWINRSLIGASTTIYIYENTSYVFNQTTTYDTQYQNSLSYNWYYDNSLVGTSASVSRSFNFFSAGSHNLTFIATDEFNKTASFSWYINVINVNRPPILVNPLTNLTGIFAVNGTTTYASYMTYHSSQIKFYDPDDDLDLDNLVDDNESTMSFTATSCPHAQFTFINNALKVTSVSVGSCLVNFTAIDSNNTNSRANATDVLVNVTYVSNETIETEVPVSRSTGGGGSSRTVTIPIPEEVEKPKPLEIITPKLVTIYRNATVTVPILINNTWNSTLEGITLSAETNASNVSIYLDRTYFPRLATGNTEEVVLTISNYKSEGHYEIQVRAKIIDPDFTDTATIYVNSADTMSDGQQLDAMISFARDLLSSNPECQELTELLNEAKKQLSVNNFEGTAKLVDSVINGCKYLVSEDSHSEKPANDFIKRFSWRSVYNEYLIIAGFIILFVVALFYIIKKEKHEEF